MRLTHSVGVLAMVGMLAVPAATANAGQNPRRAQVATPSGFDEGYRQGLRVGEDNGRRGLSFNFGISVEYRNGDYGWRPEFGNHDRYRADFRVGFERGYREAYDRYHVVRGGAPPWSNGRVRGNDLAATNGFNDGYREGLNDGRHRHRNDPFAESRYRSGDHGFEKWYGNKDQYRWSYRDAFRQGYERGYADGWRR